MTGPNDVRKKIMREPDYVIEGEYPVWACDGYRDWDAPPDENGRAPWRACRKRAVVCEHGVTLGGGHYIGRITCSEHAWRGAITANHTSHWLERLPKRFANWNEANAQ